MSAVSLGLTLPACFSNPDFHVSAFAHLQITRQTGKDILARVSVGKGPTRPAGLSSAAVNGLLLPDQRHLIAQRPQLAPRSILGPGTAPPLSWAHRAPVTGTVCSLCPQLWLQWFPKARLYVKTERSLRGIVGGSLKMTHSPPTAWPAGVLREAPTPVEGLWGSLPLTPPQQRGTGTARAGKGLCSAEKSRAGVGQGGGPRPGLLWCCLL